MGASAERAEIGERIEQRFGVNRSLLLGVGTACIVLGVVAAALPLKLFGSLIRLLGVLLLLSACVKAFQLLLGRRSPESRRRGWPLISFQVALDAAMGILLISRWQGSVQLVATLLGVLVAIEGLVLVYVALRSPTVTSRRWLSFCGLVTSAAGLVIALRLVDNPLLWAGVLVGFKLILFGVSLVWIALCAMNSDTDMVYGAVVPVPERAELYAVYFGTAFHLGVYIGDGRVVHYLDDNQVHEWTWDQFLEGRSPQHWTYPDLASLSADDVVATALSEVGKTYQYNLLKFNCEHFAIFCKSGGKTKQSIYAQVSGGVLDVVAHPFLGIVAELNTRLVEFVAFHFGGPAGKRLSLSIRRIGAAVTTRLVSLGATKGHAGPS
jgi:uncharacterized membrane protein HdeD (DUF308 family)